jgi:predicted nucleic acid-binding Zn ribbon protein
VTDIRHGFKETASDPCPSCGGSELKRIFRPAGIVFKGSGFYVTDSRKPSATDASASKTGGASKEGGPSKEAGSSKEGGASKEGGSSPSGPKSSKGSEAAA